MLLMVLALLPLMAPAAAPIPLSTPPAFSRPAAAPAVRLRQPAPGRLREFRGQHEFQYVEVKSELSAWDIFWAGFWRKVAGWLSTRTGTVAWKYGFYAVLVGAFAVVVLKLLQVDLTGAFGRAPRRAALAYDTETEDIHALDIPALLTEAEMAGNYRLAVRLGYLQVLKELTDRSLIQWQPDKTNHHYVLEMARTTQHEAFAELTRQFEYVWYGELHLTPEHYARTRTTRLGFLTQLANRRAA